MAFFATDKNNPCPLSVWLSAALVGVYGIYLFIITWIAKANADLFQVFLLIVSLWLVAVMLKGSVKAQTFLLSRAVLLAGWVILSLCLLDFTSVESTLNWVSIFSLIGLPVTDAIAFGILFAPSAQRYMIKSAAAAKAKRK